MTIVAKNSLTISNVNDGTDGKTQYTHIAYANIKFLCKENSNFTLSGVSLVRYGSDSRWVYKEFQAGTYTATTTLWGSDPASGTVKNVELVSKFSTSNSINTTHIGVYVDFIESDSVDPSKYNWTLVKGADGTQGTPGKAGADGKTPYFHTAWSNSADGTDGFSTVYPNLNLLVNSSAKTKDGFFKHFAKVENDYGEVTIKGTNIWSQIDLSDGFSIQPRDYKPGDIYVMSMDVMFTSWNFPSGTNIGEFWIGQRYLKPLWTSICNINLPGDPSQMLNQWIRITKTSTIPPYGDPSVKTQSIFMARLAGTSEASFTIRIRKPKQEPGSIATPYMPSASEVTTADWPSYIGQYTDFTQADSTNPSDYTWSLIRGNDGKDGANGKDGIAGKDGVGLKNTVITYAISTSGTTAPTSGWTTQVPTLIKGQYLWTKTVWIYTDNASETGYSVTYISKDGNNGTNGVAGKDGVGIKTTTITYVGSTSGTAAPSSGWTSSVPSVPAGQFLWTKTVWRYSDNTSETGYSVAKMGNTGATGPAGPPGSTGAPGKIVSNTEPISLFKGLTWKYSGTAKLTASDGTVIHPNTEYYYNGTHWMINYLSANNFEANSITADLIDAKNLTITDGEFVSTIINGSVKTQTEIKDDHLLIYKMDTSHNDITTIALKSDSGLGMTYQNSDTSQYTSSGINLQGIFTQDNILKNGVSLTPGGVKFTQNGVSAGLNFDGTNLSSSMPIQAPNTIVKSTQFTVSGIGIRLDRMMSFVAVTFSGRASSTINNTPTINNVLPVGFRPISPYSIDYMIPLNTANNGYIYFNPDGSIRIMATINSGYYIRGTRLYITNDVYPS
ncbi:hypothetical protein [Lactococcus lactis]|uniref:hypothetical protein n=1 Tax=Lactococcus lactis TaxID=1358 RepID=UPI0035DC28DE